MIKIGENVYWVGYIDWNLRSFHGYSTPYGTTYNAYLILDDKPTLIDTVKGYGSGDMLRRISEIIHPSKIQYIVSNHAEMDHSGAIDQLLDFCPQAEVVCSPKGKEGLLKHFKKNWKFKVVDSGETLSIGKRNLQFHLTPMVHWPDSMITYLKEQKILFSNDSFGQHYATPERFVDEVGGDIIFREAAKYYANIVMPYSSQVIKALEGLQSLNMEFICPSHGLIWRKTPNIETIIDLYDKWANSRLSEQAVIVYDSMWHSTEKIALRIYELLDKENISVKLLNLQFNHISDVAADLLSAKAIIVGSPVLNNGMLPSIASFLSYLKGLKPKNRFGFTFGSYGWSKPSFKELEEALKLAGVELICEGSYFQYIPDEKDLASLSALAGKIKTKLREE
ncbi:MAG: flavodoxin domain-containing protein [Candidatus Omnitrophica bacterium]|nr:flavodoxin domain-containing protein [Candidatus Omnitrophota bacterium]MBU2251416.1 flavodoxin domain-containing protein [Candidatus Omnitrophota bacterium]MBU2266275.1 flavodoxin domain-containing protein [Candidatus Omnitrophota bacterium]